MAGWVGFPVGDGDDLQDIALYEQITDALNERLSLYLTPTLFAAPVAGDTSPQGALRGVLSDPSSWGWSTIQESIENLLGAAGFDYGHQSFWTTPGSKSNESFPATSADPYRFQLTLAAARSAAGLNTSGFTRRYPRMIASTSEGGTNGQRAFVYGRNGVYERSAGTWTLAPVQAGGADVLESYGLAQEGDYLGPWLFNEIQAMLNQMTHLVIWDPAPDPDVGSGSGLGKKYRGGSEVSGYTTVAGAVAAAQASWNAAPVEELSGSIDAGSVLRVTNIGDASGDQFIALAYSSWRHYQETLPVGLSADAFLYVPTERFRFYLGSPYIYIGTDIYDYDASADAGGSAENTYQLVATQTGVSGTFKIAQPDATTPVAVVTTPGVNETVWNGANTLGGNGSIIDHHALIYDFRVTGGFTYW